jgi:hypothetical protein
MKIPVVLAAAIVVAGCLGGPERTREPLDPTPEEQALPPGCNATLKAVAHRAGEVVPDPPAPVPIGCMSSTGRPSFEPTIGITKAGTVVMYPASALGVGTMVTMARSDDEGATWQIIAPGAAGQSTHPYSQDPYLFVDPETDRIFAEDLLLVPPTCGMMSISDNRGESWTHTQSGCAVMDHVTIFQGPPVLEALTPMSYPNVIYRCAITGGAVSTLSTMVACQRSRDGGLTWLPPGDPAFTFLPGAVDPGCDGGNGHGATNEQGTVYLPRGHCAQPWLAISNDEAQTWTTVQVSDLGTICSPAVCEHDAGVGEDPSGLLYYAWVAADRLPYLARSADRGVTWGTPIMIAPPGLNEAALLQMAVGGNGKIAIVYYGSQNSPGKPWSDADYAETTWAAYISITLDGQEEQPLFYTAPLHDPTDPLIRGTCGPLRCQEVFDFIDIRIGPDGTPWAPIIDGCVDACATGEVKQDNGSVLYAGRLFGGASLWDLEDSNGPYPGGGKE